MTGTQQVKSPEEKKKRKKEDTYVQSGHKPNGIGYAKIPVTSLLLISLGYNQDKPLYRSLLINKVATLLEGYKKSVNDSEELKNESLNRNIYNSIEEVHKALIEKEEEYNTNGGGRSRQKQKKYADNFSKEIQEHIFSIFLAEKKFLESEGYPENRINKILNAKLKNFTDDIKDLDAKIKERERYNLEKPLDLLKEAGLLIETAKIIHNLSENILSKNADEQLNLYSYFEIRFAREELRILKREIIDFTKRIQVVSNSFVFILASKILGEYEDAFKIFYVDNDNETTELKDLQKLSDADFRHSISIKPTDPDSEIYEIVASAKSPRRIAEKIARINFDATASHRIDNGLDFKAIYDILRASIVLRSDNDEFIPFYDSLNEMQNANAGKPTLEPDIRERYKKILEALCTQDFDNELAMKINFRNKGDLPAKLVLDMTLFEKDYSKTTKTCLNMLKKVFDFCDHAIEVLVLSYAERHYGKSFSTDPILRHDNYEDEQMTKLRGKMQNGPLNNLYFLINQFILTSLKEINFRSDKEDLSAILKDHEKRLNLINERNGFNGQYRFRILLDDVSDEIILGIYPH